MQKLILLDALNKVIPDKSMGGLGRKLWTFGVKSKFSEWDVFKLVCSLVVV